MNIAKWLHQTALVRPDAPAIRLGERLHANYAEFAFHSWAIGSHLQTQYGIRRGDRVALFVKNCAEYLEVLYGVIWIGIPGKLRGSSRTRNRSWSSPRPVTCIRVPGILKSNAWRSGYVRQSSRILSAGQMPTNTDRQLTPKKTTSRGYFIRRAPRAAPRA